MEEFTGWEEKQCKKFAGELEKKEGVVAIKRKNMIKSEEESEYYRRLSKLRRRIETLFSIGENFGFRFIRTVSRRGLVVKIIHSLLAYNILSVYGDGK